MGKKTTLQQFVIRLRDPNGFRGTDYGIVTGDWEDVYAKAAELSLRTEDAEAIGHWAEKAKPGDVWGPMGCMLSGQTHGVTVWDEYMVTVECREAMRVETPKKRGRSRRKEKKA